MASTLGRRGDAASGAHRAHHLRLDLDCQGEFIAILNAIEMQLERADPDVETTVRLGDALLALADARRVDAKRLPLEKQLHALLDRIMITTGWWSGSTR